MKVKYYKHIHTDEIVYEEDAESYFLDKLGLTITGKNDGKLNEEQKEFLREFTEWYFSGNWIEDWEELD